MKTLVLDLDETLIHASLEADGYVDFELEIAGQHVFVRVRPGLHDFIAHVRKLFTPRIWSTGQPVYVQAVAKHLGLDFMELWGRDKCRRRTEMSGGRFDPYDKPLEAIGVEMGDIVIVDNYPAVFDCNPRNGIPIDTWLGSPEDGQLGLLSIYLSWLVEQNDMRREHRRWTYEALLLRNAQGIGTRIEHKGESS